jgi:hypothetical protein
VTEREENPQPVGLGGWIITFQAFIVAVVGLFLAGFIMGGGATTVTTVAAIVIVAVTGSGLYLTANKDPRTPKFWVWYLSVVTAGWVFLAMLTGTVSFGTFVFALWFIAWIVYWQRSRRVRNTFSR